MAAQKKMAALNQKGGAKNKMAALKAKRAVQKRNGGSQSQ